MENYLEETFYYNYNHAAIQEVFKNVEQRGSVKQQAIDLYLHIRDGWLYDPYTFHTSKEDLRAGEIIQRKKGHCLDKSIILISCLRARQIPARIHLSKVRNHIDVERIIEVLGSDELVPHGFVEVWIDGKWGACTPAFNQSLCKKLNVNVLEFDGENDSIFQQYDRGGGKFMEYLEDYGTFVDFPYDFVMQKLEENYPKFKIRKAQSDTFGI